jgi:hypothetical protein
VFIAWRTEFLLLHGRTRQWLERRRRAMPSLQINQEIF